MNGYEGKSFESAVAGVRLAQPDLMVLDQLLVKVPHVQIEVLVSVQAQDLFGLRLGTRGEGFISNSKIFSFIDCCVIPANIPTKVTSNPFVRGTWLLKTPQS
jgi:hypothetical protein